VHAVEVPRLPVSRLPVSRLEPVIGAARYAKLAGAAGRVRPGAPHAGLQRPAGNVAAGSAPA